MLSTSASANRPWAVAGAVALAALALVGPGSAATSGPAKWKPLIHADGAVDVAGPMTDGRLALAAGGRLFLLEPDGTHKRPFARGAHGYSSAAGEPYIALSDSQDSGGAGCRFRAGDLFALEPRDQPAIVRISRAGRARPLASFPAADFLSGITFDRVGSFGHRLLVTAVRDAASTTLYAVDCAGRKTTIATGGPRVEGGIEVAPESFGSFAGRLIAADEHSGTLFAFDPSGGVSTLAESGLPAGPDTGVEALGFVPSGFGPADRALLADNGVKEERPRVGTDSLLAISHAALARQGIVPGDLLVATETGAETIRVRCQASCEVATVASGPAIAHAEGHIAFTGGG